MKVGGVPYRAIFTAGDGVPVGHAVTAGDAGTAGDAMDVWVIDQTVLPHRFETLRLESVDDAVHAIRDMVVRGAPLIGATAAYGVALAMRADPSDASLEEALAGLGGTRPTAVNLVWALDGAGALLRGLPAAERADAACHFAARLCEEDVRTNRSIGGYGLEVFKEIARQAGATAGGARRRTQRHDALQRGVARHRRLGNRDRSRLPRP